MQSTIQALGTSRVDFVGLGDSNQLYGGHGWDHGVGYALSARAPQYATTLHSWRENDGNGSGQGYGSSSSGSEAASTGAPAPLAAFLNKGAGGLFPANYAFGSIGAFGPNNISIDPSGPLGTGGPLIGEFQLRHLRDGDARVQPVGPRAGTLRASDQRHR